MSKETQIKQDPYITIKEMTPNQLKLLKKQVRKIVAILKPESKKK